MSTASRAPMPRAFVVGAQQVVRRRRDSAASTGRAPGFDARRVAVTEERLPGLAERARRTGLRAPPAGAQIVSYEPERVVVRAREHGAAGCWCSATTTSRAGRPRWTGAGGSDRARGLPLPRRADRPRAPTAWSSATSRSAGRIGWIISLLSLAVLALVVIVGIRRRRRAAATRAPQMRATRRPWALSRWPRGCRDPPTCRERGHRARDRHAERPPSRATPIWWRR